MSYAIYKGEKNMSELVSRLFRLQGKGTQSAIKQAADALLKTNPQLKDFSKVAIGSVIAVPDTAPPLQSAVQANEFTVMRSSAVMSAQQAFSAGGQQFAELDARAIAAVKLLLGLSKSSQLRTEAAKNPDLKQALAQIATTTAEVLKDLESNLTARGDQAASLNDRMAALVGE